MTNALDDLSRDELLQTLKRERAANQTVDVRVDSVRLAPKNPVARVFYFSFLALAVPFVLWMFAGMAL
jgi:hypothetical protein